jgi:hypothetical protein
MKSFFTFFIALIIINNSFAQINSSEPLQLNKNFLVHSAGLPEEFLLFSPDSATQILFNPARAYNYRTNFVYVNYLSDYVDSYRLYLEKFEWVPSGIDPQRNVLAKGNAYNFPTLYEDHYSSSKNPTFSAAALFNAGDSKWLFTLSNGINMNKGENNTIYTEETTFDPINNYETNYLSDEYNYDSDETVTIFKLARIWKSGLKNFSIGAFGIVYNDDESGKQDFTSTSYDFFNSTVDSNKYRNYTSRFETESGELNNSRFAVGLEFAVNDVSWDYIGSLSYQKANNSGNYNGSLYVLDLDSTYFVYPWHTLRYEENRTIVKKSDSEPYFLNLNNIFQHSVDWITEDDNLFVSLNSFYSSGDISFQGNYNRTYSVYNNDELSTGDTISVNQSENFDVKSWGISFSSGYALSASLSDLFILTGIRLAGSFNHLEDIAINVSSQSGGAYNENVIKNTFAGFTLPLYLNYKIEQWISLYGGINYSYFYNRVNYDINSKALKYETNAEEEEIKAYREVTYSNWNSSKSIYAGCELRHSSGLKVQFYFDENFSTIRDWNVSVGYHF